MACDRWHGNGQATTTTLKKSSGVNPSLFYKKKHNEQLTPSERELHNILQSAAHNEVVQKRHDYTSVQKIQRDAYHEVTKFCVFPLQDPAMEFLAAMQEEYHSKQLFETDKLNTNDLNCKRRKVGISGRDEELNDLKATYISRFLAEMNYIPPTINHGSDICTSQPNNNNYDFLPELWSMEPRIFALETSTTGRRKYIVGTLGRFLQYYWRDSLPNSRHFYELIPEGIPCRLYFDLEFSKEANPHISRNESEELMTEFILEICNELRMIHDIQLDRSCIVDLDSSTEKKFSRHLIIHLPKGELFADNSAAGLFVKRFVGRLAEDLSTGILEKRHSTLSKHLFVNKQPSVATEPEASESKGGTSEHNNAPMKYIDMKKQTCFVDLGVYTKNRLFRLMSSFKYGKDA